MNDLKTISSDDNVSEFIYNSMQALPAEPSEQDLQGVAYDVRKKLINKAVDFAKDEHEKTAESLPEIDNIEILEEYEDILRKTLPPLQTPILRFATRPSALRAALLAVLGLLMGSAIGQGLSLVPDLGFGSGLVVICGILGVTIILWLSEYILRAAQANKMTLPWGKQYSWKKIRKYSIWLWFLVLGLSIVRDFFGARASLLHILESLGAFFTTGNVLGIFTNVYGILLFTALVAILIKRPKIYDKHDFNEKITIAATNWWAGAKLAAKLLVENNNLKHDPMRTRWQQIGRDIYSFAAELPLPQQQWLNHRLEQLGLEVPRESGVLIWNQNMAEQYVALGHIAEGDACYVDEPPVLENGVVVGKGVIRKVR